MRTVIDSLVALMIAGILIGVIMHHRSRDDDQLQTDGLRENVKRIEREVVLKGSLGLMDITPQGFPKTIDPQWFGASLPINELLGEGRPWMEVASSEDRQLNHPPDIAAQDAETAAYWYNPYKGIVRARVPQRPSHEQTLELYNMVNDCQLGADLTASDPESDSKHAGVLTSAAGSAAAALAVR